MLWLVPSQAGKTLGVPRGLLMFLVLIMLSEKPMSGAEIAQKIEKQTDGRWKPSCGSIYPLLAWMHDKGFTKRSPKSEERFRRYSFTEKGREFLNKQIEIGQYFLDKLEFLLPLFIGGLQVGFSKEKLRGTIDPARRLVRAFVTIRHNLDRLSEENENEIAQALTDCSRKLERIALKPKNESNINFN